jgi:hypothetical protein
MLIFLLLMSVAFIPMFLEHIAGPFNHISLQILQLIPHLILPVISHSSGKRLHSELENLHSTSFYMGKSTNFRYVQQQTLLPSGNLT